MGKIDYTFPDEQMPLELICKEAAEFISEVFWYGDGFEAWTEAAEKCLAAAVAALEAAALSEREWAVAHA